jgi:predicted nucleic acid-binding protein
MMHFLEIHAFCQISIWDALVVAAAEAGGCDTILSEDFNDGQRYCGILAQNPFA